MDRERSYLVATPFKKSGKKSLKISDFIFALSLDLKWGSPDKVRALLQEAVEAGLVRMEGDMVHASFGDEKVEVPVGFKPSKEEDVFEKGVRLIISKTGMKRKEVIALVNERQDSLQRLVNLDAVTLLVAREMGIDVRNLAEEAYDNLVSDVRQESN
ncbi:MAG: DUF2240 family protein [Methanotrichaceae archaeon]